MKNKPKNLRTRVLKIFALSTLLLSIPVTQLQAGKMSSLCQRLNSGSDVQSMASKVKCLFKSMLKIRDEQNDIKRIRQEGVAIRGNKSPGQKIKYKCAPPYSVEKPAYGGRCSKEWNGWTESVGEYLRLTCRIRLGNLNEDVKKYRKKYPKDRKKYESCFTNNLSRDFKEDYPVQNYRQFVNYLSKKKRLYKENNLSAEFYDLSRACNATLSALKNSRPEVIRENKLKCRW